MSGPISPFNSSPTTSFLLLASTPGEAVRSGEPKTMAHAAKTINSIAGETLPNFWDLNPEEFDPEMFADFLFGPLNWEETLLKVPGETPRPNLPASRNFAINAQTDQQPGPDRPKPSRKKEKPWGEMMSTSTPKEALTKKAKRSKSNRKWQQANRISPQDKVFRLTEKLSKLQNKRDSLQSKLDELEKRKVILLRDKLSQLQKKRDDLQAQLDAPKAKSF